MAISSKLHNLRSFLLLFIFITVPILIAYHLCPSIMRKLLIVTQMSKLDMRVNQLRVIRCNDTIDKTNYNHPVTIVSAYFRVKKSKHSHSDYRSWMHQTLGQMVDTPMVIFGYPGIVGLIKKTKSNRTGPIIVVVCDSIWSTKWSQRPVPKVDFNVSSTFNWTWKNFYNYQQIPLDPYKHIHSGELYAVWNNKPFMIATVAERNPFGSEFFLWVDIGSSRDGYQLRNWPSVSKLKKIFDKRSDRILFAIVGPVNLDLVSNFIEVSPPHDNALVEATFFGGTAQSIAFFYEEFTRLHDLHFSRGYSIGQEQITFNSVAFRHFGKIIFIRAYGLPPQCQDFWFYFRSFLAPKNESLQGCIDKPLLLGSYKNGSPQFQRLVI